MNGLEVLALGLGLGVRHAMDADHVVVVSTLLLREPGAWRAARVAALWGIGHTLTFVGLGLLVVLAGLRVPAAFERGAEVLVAAMLLGFGLWHLATTRRSRPSPEAPKITARPIAVGLIHGLAGSAGVALLAATTVRSRPLAAAYLCVVALGTVLGMVGLTLTMARPLLWSLRREGSLARLVTLVAGSLGVILGAWLLFRATLGAGH
jgi:nickel/cobalt exporter